jgi:hypothetical protein
MNKKNKSSQIKFGETIGVILIVYVIILLGFSWYNSITNDRIIELEEQNVKFRNNEKFDYVLNLELLRLKNRGSIQKEFDYYSLIAFEDYTKNKNGEGFGKTKENLGYAIVKVNILGSNFGVEESIVLFDNQLEDDKIESQKSYKVIVPIRDGQEYTTKLGIMEVILYEKAT